MLKKLSCASTLFWSLSLNSKLLAFTRNTNTNLEGQLQLKIDQNQQVRAVSLLPGLTIEKSPDRNTFLIFQSSLQQDKKAQFILLLWICTRITNSSYICSVILARTQYKQKQNLVSCLFFIRLLTLKASDCLETIP